MKISLAPRRNTIVAWFRIALSAALISGETVAAVLAIFAYPAATLRAVEPATFTVGAFTFKRPTGWMWVPATSPMRKAQLHLADPANPSGAGADVVFFFFGPGQGGSVDENVGRWLGQFAEQGDDLKFKIDNANVKGTKITRVQVDKGTFSSGMPGGPTTPMIGYGLSGAILESPQGDVFIKMTGPSDLVKSAAPDFAAMIQSAF